VPFEFNYLRKMQKYTIRKKHDMAHGCGLLMAYPCTILEEIILDIFL
jgi:hypothetical protein